MTQLQVGDVLEGKVTGITKFGAFVTLPDGRSGLVHISEIAGTYVNSVSEHVSEGQTVKVKVIGLNEGKINLSIKKAAEPAPRSPSRPMPETRFVRAGAGAKTSGCESSFEDKLKQFMQDSDNKMSGSKLFSEKKSKRRKG